VFLFLPLVCPGGTAVEGWPMVCFVNEQMINIKEMSEWLSFKAY
jgi:hypothetical protein